MENTFIKNLSIKFAASANAATGHVFSASPVASEHYISEASLTLVLLGAPSGKGDTSLWVCMGTSNGDMVHWIAEYNYARIWFMYAFTPHLTECESVCSYI